MSEQTPILRPASRVLLIDPADRLLLLRIKAKDFDVWITPGGGLEPGESFEDGAVRELWEETGLLGVELGPCVWVRTDVFPWGGKVYKQQERYFVVRTEITHVSRENWTEVEREMLAEHRWWALAEIEVAEARFAPRSMASLLPPILAGDYPHEPIAVGT